VLYRSVNFGAEARQTRETKYTKKRLGDTRSRSAMALSSPPAPERAAVVMARSSSYPRSCVHPPPSSCATSASMPPSFCASAIVMDGSECTHSPERRLKATAGVAGSRTTSSKSGKVIRWMQPLRGQLQRRLQERTPPSQNSSIREEGVLSNPLSNLPNSLFQRQAKSAIELGALNRLLTFETS